MFATLKTLFAGQAARNETAIRNHYALDLIEQKIRETEVGLNTAKASLAALIQRHRAEAMQTKALSLRIDELMQRAKEALGKGLETLAGETAAAIATMENELARRSETVDRLDRKITSLRLRVEKGQRQLIDLRQGSISAKAIRAEQSATKAVAGALPGAPAKEAQDLIDGILDTEETAALADIFEEIEDDLGHRTLEDRLGASGCGAPTKVSADDVLAKLNS